MNSQPILLRRPFHSERKQIKTRNMFESQSINGLSPLPRHEKLPNIYDFVGPSSVRNQIIEQHLKESKAGDTLTIFEEKQQQAEMAKSMETTIKQQSVLSKYTQSQMKNMTRDLRKMQSFKDRQLQWDRQSSFIRKSIDKYVNPTLLERSLKKLQVMPNPQKDDIIKNYVTSYWEMSLRNNNLILKRHLKGYNRYNQNQMEALMQRDEGLREIQESMPKLPVEALNRLGDKEFVMSGRNKLASESASCDPSMVSQFTNRRSRAMTDLPPINHHQEWLKMDYDSAHRFALQEANI